MKYAEEIIKEIENRGTIDTDDYLIDDAWEDYIRGKRSMTKADVELIIKIPEETYEYWKNHSHEYVLAEAIKNGIPIPKGHGAIKDVSQIEIPMCEDRAYERWVQVAIDSAPTIIAEDKEQEE